jgi:eukaryotic-like serine/threonine-protein kinase
MSASPSSRQEQPPVSALLKAILRSGLLAEADLRESLADLPSEERVDARAVAEHLVRLGRLSRFQARKLLQGTSRGLLLGPFQILAPVGKGAMGTVFLARDGRDRELVALKVVPISAHRTEARQLLRFRREMEISRRVAHPNVARTFETGETAGVCYIAMEYIPGRTLARLVNEDGPLEPARAARLFAGAAAGLAHAHDQGLIHRDFKPSNLIITPHDQAKVLDLGLAFIEGEVGDRSVVGGRGYVVGTVDYMAPEQTTDATDVDGRSDLYALGCTLYYALTGQPPFPGGTKQERMRRHRTEEPPLEELRPGVPPPLSALLRRLLAKKPEQRPQTAREVEGLLRSLADDEPLAALPVGAEEADVAAAVSALQKADTSAEYSWEDLAPPAEAEPTQHMPRRPGCGGAALLLLAVGAGVALWWLG